MARFYKGRGGGKKEKKGRKPIGGPGGARPRREKERGGGHIFEYNLGRGSGKQKRGKRKEKGHA